MLEVGSVIDGKYKILKKIGQGGMSVVYLAINERANKTWAVKEVRKDGVLDFESVKQGLVAETDILKKLSHKHLPSIIDVIDTQDSFIIIMDYVEGNSLDKALKEFGAQPQQHVIEWAKQLCDVLGYLHTREPAIIYRDMKPSNVMLTDDAGDFGSVKLIDFGTAREHKASKVEDTTCLGTRGYAAPEQYGGMGQTDARTDIYCLGATIYHLVTGMNPSQPPYEILPIRQIDPTLSSGLEKIILKCTQNNPADRYQSCAELMYDLEHYRDFEDEHIKQQKSKLKLFITSLSLTIVFTITSIFSFFVAEHQKKSNYDNMLAAAGTVQEFYDTILADTSRVEAYIGDGQHPGLVDFLIEDGELDKEDSEALKKLDIGLSLTGTGGYDTNVPVRSELRSTNPKGYQDVCYEIGEAYLFYYTVNVDKDKYNAAALWFADAVDSHPEAQIYCDIATCFNNIAKYEKANQTGKLGEAYEELWVKINELHTAANNFENNDDLKIHAWNVTVNMIQNNSSQICEVAGKVNVTALLKSIAAESSKIKSSFLEDSIKSLNSNIEATLSKVSTVEE